MAGAEGEAFDAVLVALFPLAGVVGDAAVVLDHELDFEVGGVESLPVLLDGYFGADADVVLFSDVDVPQLLTFGALVKRCPALRCPLEFGEGFAKGVIFVVAYKNVRQLCASAHDIVIPLSLFCFLGYVISN